MAALRSNPPEEKGVSSTPIFPLPSGGLFAEPAPSARTCGTTAEGPGRQANGTPAAPGPTGFRPAGGDRPAGVFAYDPLTHLPNRHLFARRLDHAVALAAAAGRPLGLILLDLDHLKRVNETLGSGAGDEILQAAARRLTRAISAADLVARLGGDEFALVVEASSAQDLEQIADTISALLREPVSLADRELSCRASMGASIYPDQARDARELLRNAGLALAESKLRTRGRLTLFRSDMRDRALVREAMLATAKAALAGDQLRPFYQPLVRLGDRRLAGFEALLRRQDENGRVHLPASISAALDDTDLAVSITDAMLGRICTDVRRWLAADLPFGFVAINAAPADFRAPGFADRLLAASTRAGVPPALLQVEVTEGVLLDHPTHIVDTELQRLSAAGIRIALDDFGMGYASLTHLRRYPVHVLKIDRSFVAAMNERGGVAIVDAILTLGRGLGLETVAEGIEDPSQADRLAAAGCGLGQGFHFSPAMPAGAAAAYARMLDRRSDRTDRMEPRTRSTDPRDSTR